MSDNGVMIIGESIWIEDKEEVVMVTCRKMHIYICKLLYMYAYVHDYCCFTCHYVVLIQLMYNAEKAE